MEKKINLLFDAAILAENDFKNAKRSGIFFTALNILKEFSKNENLNINIYCPNKKISAKLVQTLKKYFPDNNFDNMFLKMLSPLDLLHSKLTCQYKEKKSFPVKLQLIFASALKKTFKTSINYEELFKNIDIYFSPVDLIPEEIKPIKRIKKYTILYDITPILYPEYFSIENKKDYWFTNLAKSLNSEDYYFTISDIPERISLNIFHNWIRLKSFQHF